MIATGTVMALPLGDLPYAVAERDTVAAKARRETSSWPTGPGVGRSTSCSRTRRLRSSLAQRYELPVPPEGHRVVRVLRASGAAIGCHRRASAYAPPRDTFLSSAVAGHSPTRGEVSESPDPRARPIRPRPIGEDSPPSKRVSRPCHGGIRLRNSPRAPPHARAPRRPRSSLAEARCSRGRSRGHREEEASGAPPGRSEHEFAHRRRTPRRPRGCRGAIAAG